MANITIEEFEGLFASAPEGTNKKSLARLLGVTLPQPSVTQQLEATKLVRHTPKASKANPTPSERVYVSVPNLVTENGESVRGFWVNADVARNIFEHGIKFCDDNNL